MIDPDLIYSYFEENHGPLDRSTNGWYTGECPYCRQRKLYIHPENGYCKCWKGCFYGTVVQFVKGYLACDYYDARTVIQDRVPSFRLVEDIATSPVKRDIALPEGYKRILDGRSPLADRARKYLRGRDFDMNYLDMIGVGYSDDDDYFGYIIIPFKRDGDIVYFIARDFMDRGNKYRYKNPPTEMFGIGKSDVIFNEEAIYMHDKIYMMEGWADAASIGNNAISIQGKSMSTNQWALINRSPVKEIIVVSDIGAEMEALNILQRLYKTKKTKLLKLEPLKEFGKDVNDIGAARVLALEPQTPYITTLEHFHNEARSINPRKKKLLN